MKKYIAGLLSGIILAGVISVAATNIYTPQSIEIADYKVLVNSKELEFEKPVLCIDDTTYVPFREFGEKIDAHIGWSENFKQASISLPYVRMADVTEYDNLESMLVESEDAADFAQRFDETIFDVDKENYKYWAVNDARSAANIALAALGCGYPDVATPAVAHLNSPLAAYYDKDKDLWYVATDYNNWINPSFGAFYVSVRGKTGEIVRVEIMK